MVAAAAVAGEVTDARRFLSDDARTVSPGDVEEVAD
jgi:hypothetical protein